MARVLGLDYGERRIGLAISDEKLRLAFPLGTIETQDENPLLKIKEICQKNEIAKIVLGLPLTMKGKESSQAKKVRKFGQNLSRILSREVVFEDERLTDILVEKMLISEGVSRKRRKKLKDQLSAKFILQTYLERMKK